jgi:hypothetical protein
MKISQWDPAIIVLPKLSCPIMFWTHTILVVDAFYHHLVFLAWSVLLLFCFVLPSCFHALFRVCCCAAAVILYRPFSLFALLLCFNFDYDCDFDFALQLI